MRGCADTCKQGGEMHDGVMEIVLHQNKKINTEKQYPYTSGSGTSTESFRAASLFPKTCDASFFKIIVSIAWNF